MAKTTSHKSSASAEEALSRHKKQARREAKLMLEIEEANKDLKKAQEKQSKALARLGERSAYVHTLETRLEELRAPSLEPAIETPSDSAELERQQVPSELEGSITHSDENQQASPETEASTLTGEEQHDPVVEETTPSEDKVVTNEVTEGSEVAVVQDNETATEPATLEARVLYDADRLDNLGASGVMRWAMTAKHGRWPQTRTYHPDDPFALWRDTDGQRYLLDRFFTKLLQLNEVMTTETGRAMAERRIAFLRLYLQELQQELAEGGYGYDMPEEVTYRLLWDEKRAEVQKQEQPEEELQRGRVIAIHRIYEEQHLA